MGWFRSNRHMGGGLALIALVIHFVLSFGHLHVASSKNGVATDMAWTEQGAAASTPDAPGDPLSHPRFADPCAICANIHLVASLVLDSPAWLMPLQAEQELAGSVSLTNGPAWRGTAVQARAPPIA
jgi:hypothetical protein